jgi:prepilin-type N-terminal cleavage/methylation domain-containing protein
VQFITPKNQENGFTLIEISIVMVIIGLIVGGVLVGRDMIRTAELRATLSQIEKYNSAVNTFRIKYGELPGDMSSRNATAFGFAARGSFAGEGDGNGIIEGISFDGAASNSNQYQIAGESPMFWVDLSTANLVDGNFRTASETVVPVADVTGANVGLYFPSAKLGNGNYIYAYSIGDILVDGGGYSGSIGMAVTNAFAISSVTTIMGSGSFFPGKQDGNRTISPIQAYNMDKKVDDGFPMTGNVTARYDYFTYFLCGAPPCAIAASSTTCFNNGNVGTNPVVYTTSISKGDIGNCGISFIMNK